jgi:3-oxoacyl-[acyl-carrier protein] reductase
VELDLAGKAVVVTGASGAIGGAIARAFAGEGARVVVHYLTGKDRADRLVAELGSGHLALGADLTDEGQVATLFTEAARRMGPLDVLVANAGGWAGEYRDVCEMDAARWRATLEQDLTSVFLCCRAFLKIVRQQGHGSIVIIGSHAGVFGEAGDSDYAAAKAALNYGLCTSLKTEIARLARTGRVNVVAPGWTVTPAVTHFVTNPSAVQSTLQLVATRRLSLPEDVAMSVLFLASDRAARQITGQVLVVNGGQDGRMLWKGDETLSVWEQERGLNLGRQPS